MADLEENTRESLNEQHQEILKWMDYVVEQLETLKGNMEFIDEEIYNPELDNPEDKTILGQMKYEMATKVIDKAKEWLEIAVQETEDSFGDQEAMEEE